MKRAITLGGGGPAAGLHIGVLKRLNEVGITFDGVDTLTHGSSPNEARLSHAADFIRPPPLSASCHPARGLALLAFTLSYRDVEDLLAERGLEDH